MFLVVCLANYNEMKANVIGVGVVAARGFASGNHCGQRA